MPFISSGIKLNELQDRRRKLTDEQKQDIKRLYSSGTYSLRKLAKRFGVDKSTILIIVNPHRAKEVKRRIKEHWRDYVPSKKQKAEITREHRRYKQELYLKGELKNDNKQ